MNFFTSSFSSSSVSLSQLDALKNALDDVQILFYVQTLGNVEMYDNVQMATQFNFG